MSALTSESVAESMPASVSEFVAKSVPESVPESIWILPTHKSRRELGIMQDKVAPIRTASKPN